MFGSIRGKATKIGSKSVTMKQPEFVNSPLFPKELNASFFSIFRLQSSVDLAGCFIGRPLFARGTIQIKSVVGKKQKTNGIAIRGGAGAEDFYLLHSPERNPPTCFFFYLFQIGPFIYCTGQRGTSHHVLTFINSKFDLLSSAKARQEPFNTFYLLSILNFIFFLLFRSDRNFNVFYRLCVANFIFNENLIFYALPNPSTYYKSVRKHFSAMIAIYILMA